MIKTALHHRLKKLTGRGLRGAYRKILAARYGGRVSAKTSVCGARSVLVVRGDAIGDFVLFLPALRVLRHHYAGARISLVVASECAELASSFAPVDEVILFDRRRYRFDLIYRIHLIRSLRAREFDAALNPAYSRELLTDELLCCCGAEARIASAGDLNNIGDTIKRKNNAYLTRIVPASPGIVSEVDRNREFVEQLTGRRLSVEESLPRITVTEDQIQDARQLLLREGVDPEIEMPVVLFPGASNAIKVWPAERYAELADCIAKNYGAQIVLCGSRSDRRAQDAVAARVSAPVLRLAGKTSLIQLAAILARSAVYIGNDTGALHLAAAVGTPTVCILGGGHFGRFYPYGDPRKHRAVFQKMDCYHCNWECIYEVSHCICDITVEAAWETVQRVFEEVILPARKTVKPRDAVLEQST